MTDVDKQKKQAPPDAQAAAAIAEALDALEEWKRTGDRSVWQRWLERWGEKGN
jgi:hypothetical protein